MELDYGILYKPPKWPVLYDKYIRKSMVVCKLWQYTDLLGTKEPLNLDITASQVPYTDLKCHINHFISNKWQERWLSCPDDKLFKIKPTLDVWPPGFRN